MRFASPGKAAVLFGGQFGSEGKGAIAAWIARNELFDIATSNAGAQAGHTSIVGDQKFIAFHFPTIAVWQDCLAYLNAGTIIDERVLLDEIERAEALGVGSGIKRRLRIHPNAAVITDANREAEGQTEAGTTRIASTQKGVGAALAAKIRREGKTARDCEALAPYIGEVDLNDHLSNWAKVAVEVPQGFSLSLNASGFYPYTTSRDCGVAQGLADAGIHASFLGTTVMVVRTYPIRVGNIVKDGETLGTSGNVFPDQREISFGDIGQPEERTTVTGRVRRIFTWSDRQMAQSIRANRPDVVALTFINYCTRREAMDIVARIEDIYFVLRMAPPKFIFEWGPSVRECGESMPSSPEAWRKVA